MPRRSYSDDSGLAPAVLGLLSDVFGSWFQECETAGRSHGLRWDRCSTPFVVEDEGRLVAHAGVLEIPLVLDGVERVVAGLHAVATLEAWRGRGLMRRVVEEALAYCDERYETVVLTAGVPAIYERFGFVSRTEHRFVCDAPPPCGTPTHRPLVWEDAEDLAYMQGLLARRAPVSTRLGVVRERDVFLFDTALAKGLHRFEDLDLVAWMSREGVTLRLHDLVAPHIPSLAELLARVDGPVDRVEAFFAPDRLDATFVAEPCLFDGDEWFMTRGPFLPDDVPVTLPRSARC